MSQGIIAGLNSGAIVCFPTETLYALAVNAQDLGAIKNLYSIKKRNHNKPFALMVHDIKVLGMFLDINAQQMLLIKKYTPGAVTFIVNRLRNSTLPMVLGKKIGFRVPNDWIAQEILREFNKPLVATSANTANRPDSKKFFDIPKEIREKIDAYVIDDKRISGTGSTVVDLTTSPFTILRQGEIKLTFK